MTMIDRRQALAGGAALLAAGATPALAAPADTLNAAAQSRGRRFGSAFAFGTAGADRASFANPAYAALLRRDCSVLVPENEMKWQAIRPAPDLFDFSRFDPMVDWAVANGFALRGHTLLWAYSRWFPAWLNNYDYGARPASEGARVLSSHIDTVTRRYGRKITSYDVVNEAVDPDTGALRVTSLSTAMGGTEAVLDHAFRTARAAAPHAELVYNDYMSWEDGNGKHRAGVLKLLEGFRRRGVPVDTLGVQSHIGLFAPSPDAGALARRLEPEWRRFLDAVVAMGYRLIVTEFDVRDKGLPAAIAPRDKGVADFARAYLDIMLSYPQLRDVLAWGMSDRYSWLRTFEPRTDAVINRGCPYDDRFAPKPLYGAMVGALANARELRII
ncbi:glycosyl hydrolase [Sphingomonas sp. Leaf407]|uniref:endo-1,4-beta-xylanase n=1 Tax=unclassified Sphingomonas TaxID=196159 RepID=UPI0006F32215|nr:MULTISPECIES: endo-1,4-beta-xylanase [unclassified Sphingomonas]KQN37627.1 glycosyl hydrolase [Sphingomonas sp. Leaf42]KQT27994.1 glycosyl hydrolase [Sphingomonas sp. Leaf407]